MANTPNIDLVKPAGTDHALVSVLNSNSDKIDTFAGTTNAAITDLPNSFMSIDVAQDIPNNTNFNSLTTVGSYRVRSYSSASSMTNIPEITAGALYVKNSMLEHGANYKQQLYWTYMNKFYIRVSTDNGTTWTSWERLAPTSKTKTVTGTTSANGNIGLGLSPNDAYIESVFVVPSSGNGIIAVPYRYSAGELGVHCFSELVSDGVATNRQATFYVRYSEIPSVWS